MREEDVFLCIVEVCLAQLDAPVAFGAGDVDGPLVYTVVFEAGLQKDSGGVEIGEVQGLEERGEDAGCVLRTYSDECCSRGVGSVKPTVNV